jgi:hypothetical protein
MQLRSKLGAYFMAGMSPQHQANKPPGSLSLTESSESEFHMPSSFMTWRHHFEGRAASVDRPFDLHSSVWDDSFFHEATVVDDDWIAYCLAEMFAALDERYGIDWVGRRAVRRESVLASARYPDDTEVRVISAGRWPFLDGIVKEYDLRLSAMDLERLAETACKKQVRWLESLLSKTA